MGRVLSLIVGSAALAFGTSVAQAQVVGPLPVSALPAPLIGGAGAAIGTPLVLPGPASLLSAPLAPRLAVPVLPALKTYVPVVKKAAHAGDMPKASRRLRAMFDGTGGEHAPAVSAGDGPPEVSVEGFYAERREELLAVDGVSDVRLVTEKGKTSLEIFIDSRNSPQRAERVIAALITEFPELRRISVIYNLGTFHY